MKKENNYIVIPITILIVGIITIILALLESGWYYYLLGSLVGIMCHALLIKQSIKIKKYAQVDPEGKLFNIKKTSITGSLTRFALFVLVFIVLAYKASEQTVHNPIILILIAFGGYLTLKVVLIVTTMIYAKKVKE